MVFRRVRPAILLALIPVVAGNTACLAAPLETGALRTSTGPGIVLAERLRVRSAGRIVSVDLETYVVDTILAEVSPLNEPDTVVAGIFEVQSVIARTYAVRRAGRHRDEGFDLCDTTHCQLYQPARRKTSRFTAAAVQAAARTRAMVLTGDTRPIEALFHADCGGVTASADAVWGGAPLPYLKTAVDDLPDPTHRSWQVTAASEQIRKALNVDSRTAVGRKLDSIGIAKQDDSGRAAGLDIRGEKSYSVRGEVLRSVLNRTLGVRAIQSTLFTIERQGADYIFSGKGFGHGVGLCQRGAATRLRRGDSVTEVLRAYCPGTRLTRAGHP